MRDVARAWVVVCVALAGVTRGAADAGPPPDVAEMVKAARRTAADLTRRPASWTALLRQPNGAAFRVDVVRGGGMTRWAVSIERGQKKLSDLVTLIERDGAWYGTEPDGVTGKYRPGEFPFTVPGMPVYLRRAEPLLLADAGQLADATYQGMENGAAVYRTPLSPELREMMAGTVRQMEELARKGAPSAATTESIEQGKDLLERGIPVHVDPGSGIVVYNGSPRLRLEVRDFKWLDAVPGNEVFGVGERRWADHTGDPTALDPSRLATIGHCGFWRPGTPSRDYDGRLLDLETGSVRRIPFDGDSAVSACFVRGRKALVAVGIDTLVGRWGLYEIDLKTRANREIGRDVLAGGMAFQPAVSPDGKTVAVVRIEPGKSLLKQQVCLVDLESGRGRTVGEPLAVAFLAWQADGRGLVLVRHEDGPLDKVAPMRLVRMDLAGRVTPLMLAGEATVLGDGRILYEDTADGRKWKTCDLEGKDVRLYGDGLEKYGFPSVGPDGRRVLFMRFDPSTGPRPVIVEDGKVVREVPVGPGLWAVPGWR